MPKRIPFHVVYATSEDSSYPACELNGQGPAARGWRSDGTAPHELLLRLTTPTSVHKLQLLAHHQLIPASVEVLVSGGLVSEGAATPCGATYTSVGKVTLAAPTLQARTRELRYVEPMEVLVSGGLVYEGAATPCGATYTSVGKVTLAASTLQARTRELRYVEPMGVLVSGGLVSEGAATPCGATYTSVGKVTLAAPTLQARTRELRYVEPMGVLVSGGLVSEGAATPRGATYTSVSKVTLSAPTLQARTRELRYVEPMGVLVSGGLVSEGAATPCGATYTSVGKVTLAAPMLQARTREIRYVEPMGVLVSGGLVSEGAATPCGATYTSVGKVTLAAPTLQARTRELRSAALPEPTIARFVKLKLSGPHPPAQDTDQVALMAVNVLGEEVEDAEKSPVSSKEATYSPYDDLAFVMYVDTEIADLVRALDGKKKTAVCEERFEYARRLKSAGAALAAAGIRIGRWRLRKRTAAARDDFELARRMRDRIADALCGVKEDAQLCRLFEEQGPDRRNDSSMPAEYDFSHHLSPSVAAGSLSLDIVSPVPPLYREEYGDEERNDEEEIVNEPESPVHTRTQQILQDEVDYQQTEPEQPQSMPYQAQHTLQYQPSEPQPQSLPFQPQPHSLSFQPQTLSLQPQTLTLQQTFQTQTAHQAFPQQPEEKIKEDIQKKEEDDFRKETDSPRRSITPNAANGTLVRRRNKSAGPRSTFEAYEERLLPALRHSHTNEYLREAKEEEASGGSATSHPRTTHHKLNERERKQAALPILIFGYPLVEKFYSKNYLDKEEGLARLRSELTCPSNGSSKTSPNKTARAAALLLQRALRDKVFSVYSQANEVLRALFQEFVPNRVCAAEVGRCLEKLLPELLRACGDPAPRVHSTAQHTVLTVADCPPVRSIHMIPQQLVRPVAASMHPRLALSRLQMLEQLILSHGISTDKNSGLTVRRLAECGAAGAQHAAGSVRAAAERILLAAYARSPRVVRAQLPPDDAVTRRNLIYRHLFQQFDRMDMQKILNQAPTEEQLNDQSAADTLETASVSQSTRSTVSGMTSSLGMTSSIGAMSSYSLKSMTSSASGATLAPSLSGSFTSNKTKSSLKKSPTKKYTPALPSRTTKDFSNYPGYNKLRLDSATSPKHSPRSSAAGAEKVHFQESQAQIQTEVVYRRTQRNAENRHSMIHYDHEPAKPQLKERPITVYEPLHIDYRDSPSLGSPKTKNDRSMDSLPIDSPQMSRNDLRCDSDSRSLDSPKIKADYFRENALESPKLVAGMRNLHLDDQGGMDESGYYSPGRRNQASSSETQYEAYEGSDACGDSVSESVSLHTTCTWCGRRVRAEALEAHYWRRCVMLARCPHCRVALEARMLHAHLLEECTMSEGCWKVCQKCGVALRVDESDYHANCIPLGMDEWKCPYCFKNVLARDLPWQRHLIQCPRNPRTTQAS